MREAGQTVPGAVTEPPAITRTLRAKLILEEALETIQALGFTVRLWGDVVTVDNCGFLADRDVDLEGVADGCADLLVVPVGTLIAFGIDDEELLEEVDQASLRKFGPGGYMRDDGKWMKPPDWQPPNIARVLYGRT